MRLRKFRPFKWDLLLFSAHALGSAWPCRIARLQSSLLDVLSFSRSSSLRWCIYIPIHEFTHSSRHYPIRYAIILTNDWRSLALICFMLVARHCVYVFLLKSVQPLLQRCLQYDMPSLFAFDLIRESDQEFETRTGWTYHAGCPIVLPSQLLNVGQP